MAAKSSGNGPTVFRLGKITSMQDIPDQVWEALEKKCGTKRGELPTFGGGGRYYGKFPKLESVHPGAVAVLREFDGKPMPSHS